MRKSAFEIGLELDRAADHMPGPVFELRIQQILDASPVGCVGRRKAGGFVQRVERLAGGVSVTRETHALGPATVGLLLRQQLFVYRDLWIWLNDPFQPPPIPTGVPEQLTLQLG